MSKLFKKVAVLLLAVALLVPGLVPANANPNDFGPPTGTGSITVTRFAGENYTVAPDGTVSPVAPGHGVAGVPIRIQQVTFANGLVPTTANLLDADWMAANATFVGTPQYGVTTAPNGEVVFNNLPQGIWLVQELASATIAGELVTNPIDSYYHFADFIVGIPRWVEGTPAVGEPGDENYVPEVPGEWNFHVRVYPKSGIPEYGGGYKNEVYFAGSIATWELGHRIPNAVASLPYFSAVDTLPSALTFITGSVEGRFTATGDTETIDSEDVVLTDWDEVTGVLTAGTHFTVSEIGNSVVIEITEAGRLYLAENGILGEGYVMFRLDTEITSAGTFTNEGSWILGTPPTECPVDDPDCDDDDRIVMPCDPAVEDCNEGSISSFNLELLKLNIAQQRLAEAEFALYRELTEAELEAYDYDETLPAGAINIGTDEDPNYVVPLTRRVGTTDEQITGTTGADGTTRFGNAVMSSYSGVQLWLREVEAPTGYRVIDEWMAITVNTETAYEDTYVVHVTVFNEPEGDGWNLPETGGVGTVVLTVAGLALVGGALVLFLGGKKEEDVA